MSASEISTVTVIRQHDGDTELKLQYGPDGTATIEEFERDFPVGRLRLERETVLPMLVSLNCQYSGAKRVTVGLPPDFSYSKLQGSDPGSSWDILLVPDGDDMTRMEIERCHASVILGSSTVTLTPDDLCELRTLLDERISHLEKADG